MLTVTRKVNDCVLVGKDIIVKVSKIDRNRIMLGFQAPRSLPIYRSEMLTPEEYTQVLLRSLIGHPLERAVELAKTHGKILRVSQRILPTGRLETSLVAPNDGTVQIETTVAADGSETVSRIFWGL